MAGVSRAWLARHVSASLRLWLELWLGGSLLTQISLIFLQAPLGQRVDVALIDLACFVVVFTAARVERGNEQLRLALPALLSFAALAGVGLATTGLAPAVTGVYVVMFVYIGLTQRSGSTIKQIPIAGLCWLITNQPIDRIAVARLPIALGIWLLIGEILSRVVGERDRERQRLEVIATRDALTGLYNRHRFDERLQQLGLGAAVVFLDLDHFKSVNDLFGHDTGDLVLADLGRVVLAVLRPKDEAFRYGGEEIVLLLPATPMAGVKYALKRLQQGWLASHPEISFSAGVAIVDAEGGHAAVGRADKALYEAKHSGRNTVRYATGSGFVASPPKIPKARQADSGVGELH